MTYPDTQEFAEDLWKIKEVFPGDQNLEYMENWRDLWVYLHGVRMEKVWKHQISHDPFGWYRRSYNLGKNGWELKELGDYYSTPEETLIDVMSYKNSIYEYFY